VALLTLAALTACGDKSDSSAATSALPTVASTTLAPPTTAATTVASVTTTMAPTPIAPTTTPAPTTVPAPTAASPCAASSLSLTSGQTDGAMGSVYTPLVLSNTGAVACTVSTHVVLSFLDGDGQSIGASVSTPEGPGPGIITLNPTESRFSYIRYGQAGAMDCQPIDTETTAQLVVNQTEALTLAPMAWPLCPDHLADQVSLNDLDVSAP
jgi:hypothetical protein